MSGTISKQYRKKALAERNIPGDFAFLSPTFPPVPKVQQKAKREEERKTKVDAKFRAKNTLPKPRILHSVSKSKGRKRKSKNQEKRKRAKGPQNKE